MPMTQKGAISFGLVHIPVELHTAMQDNDIHFNQLVEDPESGQMSRIRYKKVCGSTGREVNQHEIKRGYEYDKGRYVLVADAEIESLKSEKQRNLTIEQFTDLDAIPPYLFSKAYHLVPQAGGEKPFELLRQVMLAERQVALARTVIGSTERMVVIMPREEGLVMQTLFFEANVKPIPKPYQRPEVAKAEVAMARQLVGAMKQPVDLSGLEDAFQGKLRKLIDEKIAAEETETQRPDQGMTAADLMEALKASLNQKAKKPTRPKPAKQKLGKAC